MAAQAPVKPQVLPPGEEMETPLADNALAQMNKSELEMMIDFAERRPRTMDKFRKRVKQTSTFNETIALQMTYSKPQAGGAVTGPSARFAEIIASAWGNCMAMSRVVGADESVVRAQGLFYDCETNYRFGREVARSILTKEGKRFSADMITTTGSAAASIAFRNSVLNGISKGIWLDLWEETKLVAVGEVSTIAKQREELVKWFVAAGVTGTMLFNALRISGIADIGPDQLIALKTMQKQIKDGDNTIDDLFGAKEVADIEALMTDLGWNEGLKIASRAAYRGRPAEHLDYLRQELARAGRSYTDKPQPAKAKTEPKPQPKPTPAPAAAAPAAQPEPEAEAAPAVEQQAPPPAQAQAQKPLGDNW